MLKTLYDIYEKAIETYGAEAQEGVAQEECAELIQAISKKHRGKKHNIAEEIADVEIMLEQLKIINDCFCDVESIKQEKVARLEKRLEEEICQMDVCTDCFYKIKKHILESNYAD